ncbi:hypothetical protein LSUE1_G006968 [Lachnellula suecica]|uniref:Rhodopsin domain-containing protein n=1 Tax=Lachnellula suecica TaxID=602035 RepID=A0A8T9C790_9HELO|nr:hypothetical protein LSUE1_G006968 [Lachnellula suecica]
MAAEDRGPQLAAVIIFLLIFALATVGMRCYSMAFVLKRFYVEDWLSVTTLAFYIAYSVFALLAVHYGLGQHVVAVPLKTHPQALLFKWLSELFYVIIASLVKLIVCLLLLRICTHQHWQRVTLYSLLGVVLVFNAFYIFIVIFQCQPVGYYWHRYDPNPPVSGKCNDRRLATIPTYISPVLNVVSDFTLALLPVSFVWNYKMDNRTKVSVVGVLALGSMLVHSALTSLLCTDSSSRASFATVARVPYTHQLVSTRDYLYNFTDLAIWSSVEIGIGLGASSLATVKPLLRKLNILAASTSPTGRNGSRQTVGSSRQRTNFSLRSFRIGSNSFSEIDNDTSTATAWPTEPGESADHELGLRERSVMDQSEAKGRSNDTSGDVRDVEGRAEHKFSRPQQSTTSRNAHWRMS